MKTKKFILPLILILLLTFTLAGYGADLFSTYDHRIKLTIDSSKIDSALSDFPVTVFFTSTQAEEIFTEFDADSDYMKCAFTASDGTTQLYAEKELFDDSEQKAIYHVKVTSVSSSAGTDIYYYYDNNASDNTTYIGAINTTAGGNVWDSNFKAVYHMTDATTSTVADSTSNSNDGTKKAANEPVEATGKVGQGQDFDGTNAYIDCGDVNNDFDVGTSDFTIEAIINNNDKIDYRRIVHSNNGSVWIPLYITQTTGLMRAGIDGLYFSPSGGSDVCDGNWNNVVLAADRSANATFYLNGVSDGTADISAKSTSNLVITNLYLGYGSGDTFWKNKMDEVRISITLRTAAWIKATYNSLWDSLLTYGSEETKPEEEEGNALFWFNF